MAEASRARIDDVRLNVIIAGALLVAHGLAFSILPLWLVPTSAHWLWLLVPMVLLTTTHWAMIHEAIHGNLHHERRANDRLGRALAIVFGSPFDLLRFGHLSHHALNGSEPERPDLYRPEQGGLLMRIVYYVRLLIGLYAAELLGTLVCLLPRRLLRPLVRWIFYDGDPEAQVMADRAERQLLEPGRLARTRVDAGLIVALFGLTVWLYGAFWPALVLALLGRAFLVSFMDNAPHYGGEAGDRAQGFDLRAPRAISNLILNSNLHGTHHRHPNAPWRSLPDLFAADGSRFTGPYLTVPWRQLRGPVPVAEGAKPTRRAGVKAG
ncbi:MAG: fatty acid desaturase [Geminicoccaceae bacterium]|nr:fatty acid desaturase [Geminicoccaceae bacterium]